VSVSHFPLSTLPGDFHSPAVPVIYHYLFAGFAFVLGASIGSFLNVCIYRLPRDLSVNNPKRSFCPACNYPIPWTQNVPLLSWLILGGKCANCRARISFRYFAVELLTGLLFLGVWLHVWPERWVLAFPYWILVSLFVVATFIDFEHFIIPDEITWGGVAAGVVLSLAMPALQGVDSNLMGGVWAVIGAASGYFTLWGVVELGKKAFGKKRVVFNTPERC
jgi:leader peptidase (prepilin peptidase)/N-methyltransferase